MKASMTFINDYVNIKDIDPKTFSDEMTMSGTKVEGYENLGEEINNVVVGKILSVEKHPDADKLVVCMVDVGKESIQIVTGAPNVFEGALVPVALHKSNLPGGVKITKGKLRGVESCGMFCSHEELGMNISDYEGACEDGVIIFKEDIAPGTDVKEALSLDENIIEFEITPNRADCYSVLGLAREAAVTFGRPLEIKKPKVTGNSEKASDYASIEVEDTALCPRYAARIVKNVKIGPSPKWLRDRLKGCGIRSINNVVDITNFLLMEYGQPMHAFDLSYLEDSKIVVRRAKDGEKITTLDGKEYDLTTDMLGFGEIGGVGQLVYKLFRFKKYEVRYVEDGRILACPICRPGYDIEFNQVFWEFDKHSADGTFERIIEVWNNDFRAKKKNVVIKWVDESGKRKATQNGIDGSAPVWLDASGNANDNGEYIKVKHTKAEKRGLR